MGFDEKTDVIDLMINFLKEHEKTLDTLAEKLERTLDRAAIKEDPRSEKLNQVQALAIMDAIAGALRVAFQDKITDYDKTIQGVIIQDFVQSLKDKGMIRHIVELIKFGTEKLSEDEDTVAF